MVAHTAQGQAVCAGCWNSPDIEIGIVDGAIAARRCEPGQKTTRQARHPKSAHFLTYSIPSVAVDAGDICVRFEYPGGYDLHRLSVTEAQQIAGELELAVRVLAKED